MHYYRDLVVYRILETMEELGELARWCGKFRGLSGEVVHVSSKEALEQGLKAAEMLTRRVEQLKMAFRLARAALEDHKGGDHVDGGSKG